MTDRSVERKRGAWTKAEPYTRKDGTQTRGTTVYLPTDILDALREEAHRLDVSQSSIVETALRARASAKSAVSFDEATRAENERLKSLLESCAQHMTREQMFNALRFAEPEIATFVDHMEGA